MSAPDASAPLSSARPVSALRNGWRLALGTLTALPVTPPETIDRPAAARAMLLAPVASLFGAAALTGVAVGAWQVLGAASGVAATLGVGALALSSAAMHLDGLADTADGLACARWNREKALDVMRRSDTGPMGAAAVLIVLLLQIFAVQAVLENSSALRAAFALSAAVVLSRCSLSLLTRAGVPSARPQGLGATVAGSVPRPAASLCWLAAAVATLGLGTLLGLNPWLLIAASASVGLVSMYLIRRATTAFGGITGDVLGAGVELSLAAALVVLGLLPG